MARRQALTPVSKHHADFFTAHSSPRFRFLRENPRRFPCVAASDLNLREKTDSFNVKPLVSLRLRFQNGADWLQDF